MQKEGGKRQLLVIDPKTELQFHGPYDQVVTEHFTLHNPTPDPIAFKVKTTAPKRYCVRPNNGMVAPHQKVLVSVMLQPGDLTQEKNKHKFMIQSAVAPSSASNIDELFKSISPEEIMDSKFKCVFVDAGPKSGLSLVNNNNSGGDHHLGSVAPDSSAEMNKRGGTDESEISSAATNGHHEREEVSSSRFEQSSSVASASATATSARGAPTSGATSNTSRYNDTYATTGDRPHASREPADVEKDLKLAQEEIRDLKEKLQQVQRYASRNLFGEDATGQTSTSSTSSARQAMASAEGTQVTQLYQYAALVVFVGIIIGYLMGKLV